MKRFLALLALVVFLGAMIISCGSSKTCPAYSKADTEQSSQNNS